MRNRVIAITGQSGSGKSTVSKCYQDKGFKVIDCDEIVKTVHHNKDCQVELIKEFGDDIIENGEINTKILSQKAFLNDKTLQKLTDITHPFIIKVILDTILEYHKNGDNIVFVDGAVIIGHEFEKYCDEFIVVLADYNKQIDRIAKRDNISKEKAEKRIKRQTSYTNMLFKANYVVSNNAGLELLLNQAEFVLKQILSK